MDPLGLTAEELLDAFVNRPSFERFGEMREAIMRKWPVESREPRQTDVALAVRNAVVICAMMIEANNKRLLKDLEALLGPESRAAGAESSPDSSGDQETP